MTRRMFLLFLLGCFFLAGCARGEQPSWGEAGRVITFRITCRDTLDANFTYRVAIDTDGNALTGPSSDPEDWRGLYILEWKRGTCWLSSPDGASTYILDSSFSGKIAEATVNLSDLGSPTQIEVMVVAEDAGGNVISYLRRFFTMRLRYQYTLSRDENDVGGDASKPSGYIIRVDVVVSF